MKNLLSIVVLLVMLFGCGKPIIKKPTILSYSNDKTPEQTCNEQNLTLGNHTDLPTNIENLFQ